MTLGSEESSLGRTMEKPSSSPFWGGGPALMLPLKPHNKVKSPISGSTSHLGFAET